MSRHQPTPADESPVETSESLPRLTRADNDNGAEPALAQCISPKQARELARISMLLSEATKLASRLEQDLLTQDAKARVRAGVRPRPEVYAEMAKVRRKLGLPNK